MNLNTQQFIAKSKRDHAAKTTGPRSRVTIAREQDLKEITNRILRRDLRKSRGANNG